MTDMVNVHVAKTQFSRLLERVEAGETIVVARAGKPIADLSPHKPRRVRCGTLAGRVAYKNEDIVGPDGDVAKLFGVGE